MSKNKVKERCQKEEFAKFYYTSQKMFYVLKAARVVLYALAILPVILALIPAVDETYTIICAIISFSLSILNESLGSFLNEYKEKAVMEYQLYETGITGSEFSKIEYDRENTNELNELAIRKGLTQMRDKEKFHEEDVPDDISDDYSYLYLCRRAAATNNYLLSRIFYIYLCSLIVIAVGFVVAVIAFRNDVYKYLTLIITFYPLVSPIIKACGKSKECMKKCTKLCADVDNYFADGDVSLERLARMHYYVQNLEFEMLVNRPTIYGLFRKLFKKGTENLQEGVTIRFKSAIVELKSKSMMHKGIISQPKGKALITKVDYDMDKLTKIEKSKKQKSKAVKAEIAPQDATLKEPKKKAAPAQKSESGKKATSKQEQKKDGK